jgi:phage gp46-like protein
MSALRRNIDGATGLYTVVAGDYQDDGNSPQSKVILALNTRRGSAAADPDLGSRLHTIRSTEPRDRELAKLYTFEALSRLKSQGQISNIVVTVDLDPEVLGRLCVQVEYTNRAGVTETVNTTTGT